MIPHVDFPRFHDVLKRNAALFTPWKGDVLRQSIPRWQSKPYRFTGIGSVLAGGRWNVKELMAAVYASTNPDTLNAEAFYKGRRYGWNKADFKAQLIIGMHWELQNVVNLTKTAVLKALGVKKSDVLACDWDVLQKAGEEPVTQAIARAAFENSAEGLVVPSARHHGGVNLVYYPTHRWDGTVILTLDEANIPFVHGL